MAFFNQSAVDLVIHSAVNFLSLFLFIIVSIFLFLFAYVYRMEKYDMELSFFIYIHCAPPFLEYLNRKRKKNRRAYQRPQQHSIFINYTRYWMYLHTHFVHLLFAGVVAFWNWLFLKFYGRFFSCFNFLCDLFRSPFRFGVFQAFLFCYLPHFIYVILDFYISLRCFVRRSNVAFLTWYSTKHMNYFRLVTLQPKTTR